MPRRPVAAPRYSRSDARGSDHRPPPRSADDGGRHVERGITGSRGWRRRPAGGGEWLWEAHGRNPVVGTALLDDIATRRAAHIAQEDKLEHHMAYVSQRLNDAGVCWSGFGEIIAWENYPDYSPDRAMEMWWNSPPHHDIMLGADYNAAGGDWDTADDGGHYSVMVFVTLCGPSAAAEPGSVLFPDDRYGPESRAGPQGGRGDRVSPGALGRGDGPKVGQAVEDCPSPRRWPHPRKSRGLAQGRTPAPSRVTGCARRRLLRARPDPARQIRHRQAGHAGARPVPGHAVRPGWAASRRARATPSATPGRCPPRRRQSSTAATTSCSAPARCRATGCATRRRCIQPDGVRREPPS